MGKDNVTYLELSGYYKGWIYYENENKNLYIKGVVDSGDKLQKFESLKRLSELTHFQYIEKFDMK